MFQDLINLHFIESQMPSNALCEVMSWKLMLGVWNHNRGGGGGGGEKKFFKQI
jgi:hypothetical protein